MKLGDERSERGQADGWRLRGEMVELKREEKDIGAKKGRR